MVTNCGLEPDVIASSARRTLQLTESALALWRPLLHRGASELSCVGHPLVEMVGTGCNSWTDRLEVVLHRSEPYPLRQPGSTSRQR
jgi:hypothetical protein